MLFEASLDFSGMGPDSNISDGLPFDFSESESRALFDGVSLEKEKVCGVSRDFSDGVLGTGYDGAVSLNLSLMFIVTGSSPRSRKEVRHV